ncbi:MAG TPA: hypothetical protein VGI10_14710 [Polyangiaceae bacterium]
MEQLCQDGHCVPAECDSNNQATACHGFACDEGVCGTVCDAFDGYQSGCAPGFHCDGFACVAGEALENGRACMTNGACLSQTCCAKPSGSVCTSTCSTPPTDACTTGLDCLSGNCCQGASGASTCSAVPCPATPECTIDANCASGLVCLKQKCTQPPGKSAGSTCATNAECTSGSCVSGLCRGTAATGQACAADTDCLVARVCCQGISSSAKTCSKVNLGCPGIIGGACQSNSDCIGGNCNVNFCTKTCQVNKDCGTSPWGVPNACETNGLGNKICFPGCTTTQQCADNLSSIFQCLDALDSVALFCAAG